GLSALLLLAFQGSTATLRDDIVSLSFPWRWVMFTVLSGIYFGAFFAITSGLLRLPGQHVDLLGRWAVCVGLYPLVVLGLAWLDRYVLYPRRKE
ncbi:MAG: hypothetical protein AAF337_10655, partial [Pseudomonadota bacterium]